MIGCSHNPNKTFISVHLKEIGKNLGVYSSKYDNFILLGDLNSKPKEQSVEDFCQVCNCKNVIKGNTCFKNPANSCCIDLLITNRPACFQGSMIKETGLSDFHKMSLPSRYGCISDASLRRLIQRLRDISNRADLKISETSPGILIKDVSSEMSQRFLRFSQRRRWVVSERVNLFRYFLATCASTDKSLYFLLNYTDIESCSELALI